jgi:hypothetical protein
VNPITVQNLAALAERDGIPLREFAAYVLSDYVRHAPPDEASEK